MGDKFDAGLGQLVGSANRQPGKDFDPTRCMRVMVPLAGTEYFVAGNTWGPTQIGMTFDEAYSEIRDKEGVFIGVKRHEKIVLVTTGFIMEPIPLPSWWSKRNSGGI